MSNFLRAILLETKAYYREASIHIEAYQLRHACTQLVGQRLYLIDVLDLSLAQSAEELALTNIAKPYRNELDIIEQNQQKITAAYEDATVLNSIIKCEKAILLLIKTLLMEAKQQNLRNMLSSLAASIQIGLDKLEQLKV